MPCKACEKCSEPNKKSCNPNRYTDQKQLIDNLSTALKQRTQNENIALENEIHQIRKELILRMI